MVTPYRTAAERGTGTGVDKRPRGPCEHTLPRKVVSGGRATRASVAGRRDVRDANELEQRAPMMGHGGREGGGGAWIKVWHGDLPMSSASRVTLEPTRALSVRTGNAQALEDARGARRGGLSPHPARKGGWEASPPIQDDKEISLSFSMLLQGPPLEN